MFLSVAKARKKFVNRPRVYTTFEFSITVSDNSSGTLKATNFAKRLFTMEKVTDKLTDVPPRDYLGRDFLEAVRLRFEQRQERLGFRQTQPVLKVAEVVLG